MSSNFRQSFWFKYDSDGSAAHPEFDPTEVRTHDSTFHVAETPALTTEVVTSANEIFSFPKYHR